MANVADAADEHRTDEDPTEELLLDPPVQADLLRARLRLRGRIVQVRVSLGSASG